jgi:hypothetical protein
VEGVARASERRNDTPSCRGIRNDNGNCKGAPDTGRSAELVAISGDLIA